MEMRQPAAAFEFPVSSFPFPVFNTILNGKRET
jgi:hypothetical protein